MLHPFWRDLILPQAKSKDNLNTDADLSRAIGVARSQQARWWELRAALSLARLWRDRGKHDLARQVLTDLLGRFTEGFDTHDLQKAGALLEELAN